jgi:hypothetical protein
VNVWCGVIDNRLIGPFVFDNNLTRDTYGALPGLLEDIPLMVRSQMYFQHDGAPPHFFRVFPSVVRQMPGYNSSKTGHGPHL